MSARRRDRVPGTGATNRSSRVVPETSKPANPPTPTRSFAATAPGPGGVNRRPSRKDETGNRVSATSVSSERKRTMATNAFSMVPTSKEWQSEAKSKNEETQFLSVSHADPDEQMEEKMFIKKKGELKETKLRLVGHARDRLVELAVQKYGNLGTLFKDLDDNEMERVSLDEFSKMVKTRNMQNYFPRTQQRTLFEYLDYNKDEHVNIKDLKSYLCESDKFQGKPTTATIDAISVAARQEKVDLQRVKDEIVDKIFARRRAAKLQDGQDYATVHLMKTFHAIDEDMSGSLDRKEMVEAFGPNHMNLGIKPGDMQALLQAMDTDGDGSISYKEFIKYLEVHDIDPDYNPFYDARQRELMQLKKLAKAPWKFEQQTHDDLEEFQRLQDWRLADLHAKEEAHNISDDPEVDRTQPPQLEPVYPDFHLTSDLIMAKINETRELKASGKMANDGRMATSKSLPAMSSSVDLFADMQRTQQIQMDGICPRFVPPPATDWSRVGYGGNGTDKQSGHYQQINSRFQTTNKEYFAPLEYKPNQPVKRNTVSDADRGTIERKKFVVERRRKQQMRDIFAEKKAVHDEVMDEMDKEQRLKNTASDLYHYYQRTYQHDLDQLKRQPPEIMQKRPNRSADHRMWNGSKDNQHNLKALAPKPEWATELGRVGKDHRKASPVHHLGFYIMNGPPKPDQI